MSTTATREAAGPWVVVAHPTSTTVTSANMATVRRLVAQPPPGTHLAQSYVKVSLPLCGTFGSGMTLIARFAQAGSPPWQLRTRCRVPLSVQDGISLSTGAPFVSP